MNQYFYYMYNINQLNEMSDEQLRELAKSMGLKKVDSVNHDGLVYQVLDHQAETEAANSQEPGKRRRERIRQPAAKANGAEVTKDDAVANKGNKNKNNKKAAAELPNAAPDVTPQSDNEQKEEPVAEPPKRKRGRPSAAEKAARDAALAAEKADNQPQQEMTAAAPADDEPASDDKPVAAQPAKRRGRKPKQAAPQPEEPVLPFDNMELGQPAEPEAPVAEAGDNEPALSEPVQQQQPSVEQEPREREGVSLNSFFNTGSSFTFKPRRIADVFPRKAGNELLEELVGRFRRRRGVDINANDIYRRRNPFNGVDAVLIPAAPTENDCGFAGESFQIANASSEIPHSGEVQLSAFRLESGNSAGGFFADRSVGKVLGDLLIVVDSFLVVEHILLIKGKTHSRFGARLGRGVFVNKRGQVVGVFFLRFLQDVLFRLRLRLRDGVELRDNLPMTD